MKTGVRRGAVPQEELEWIEEHIHCDSINQLFRDYSKQFNSPYTCIISFRKILAKYDLHPITKSYGFENVNRMLFLVSKGKVHWEYNGESFKDGLSREPHWLWRWHGKSKRTSTGVMFRQYPITLKEKQFGEDMERRDPH